MKPLSFCAAFAVCALSYTGQFLVTATPSGSISLLPEWCWSDAERYITNTANCPPAPTASVSSQCTEADGELLTVDVNGTALRRVINSLGVNQEGKWKRGRYVDWRTGRLLDSDSSTAFDRYTSASHSGKFAAAVAERFGAYLLHPPRAPANELLAYAQYDWLKNSPLARHLGWKPVMPTLSQSKSVLAQQLANRGHLVFLIRPTDGQRRFTHIAVVRPRRICKSNVLSNGPTVSQAAECNYNRAPASVALICHELQWDDSKLEYFTYNPHEVLNYVASRHVDHSGVWDIVPANETMTAQTHYRLLIDQGPFGQLRAALLTGGVGREASKNLWLASDSGKTRRNIQLFRWYSFRPSWDDKMTYPITTKARQGLLGVNISVVNFTSPISGFGFSLGKKFQGTLRRFKYLEGDCSIRGWWKPATRSVAYSEGLFITRSNATNLSGYLLGYSDAGVSKWSHVRGLWVSDGDTGRVANIQLCQRRGANGNCLAPFPSPSPSHPLTGVTLTLKPQANGVRKLSLSTTVPVAGAGNRGNSSASWTLAYFKEVDASCGWQRVSASPPTVTIPTVSAYPTTTAASVVPASPSPSGSFTAPTAGATASSASNSASTTPNNSGSTSTQTSTGTSSSDTPSSLTPSSSSTSVSSTSVSNPAGSGSAILTPNAQDGGIGVVHNDSSTISTINTNDSTIISIHRSNGSDTHSDTYIITNSTIERHQTDDVHNAGDVLLGVNGHDTNITLNNPQVVVIWTNSSTTTSIHTNGFLNVGHSAAVYQKPTAPIYLISTIVCLVGTVMFVTL